MEKQNLALSFYFGKLLFGCFEKEMEDCKISVILGLSETRTPFFTINSAIVDINESLTLICEFPFNFTNKKIIQTLSSLTLYIEILDSSQNIFCQWSNNNLYELLFQERGLVFLETQSCELEIDFVKSVNYSSSNQKKNREFQKKKKKIKKTKEGLIKKQNQKKLEPFLTLETKIQYLIYKSDQLEKQRIQKLNSNSHAVLLFERSNNVELGSLSEEVDHQKFASSSSFLYSMSENYNFNELFDLVNQIENKTDHLINRLEKF
ncbi:hypothetical protein M0813_25218 [Anaeramoeba flamelloides]|uniref:Uncharacterized protein n=1 Tax=Anaeramoeba flamelloides TaxID=1746091 RepID=A0ABQ8Y3D3_9EUKA|nr:hypothetical protein M0813_25218 [Anaeramoeba flamelloides]